MDGDLTCPHLDIDTLAVVLGLQSGLVEEIVLSLVTLPVVDVTVSV